MGFTALLRPTDERWSGSGEGDFAKVTSTSLQEWTQARREPNEKIINRTNSTGEILVRGVCTIPQKGFAKSDPRTESR